MLTATQLPDPKLPWPINMDGVALIAETEQGPGGGVALRAYRCPAGVWTCGWGETDGVGPNTKWSKAYADSRFCDSLEERAAAVKSSVTYHTTDNQLAALVSFAYNVGIAGFRRSGVLAAHNRGDHQAAARAFALWNKATVGGVLTVLPGLVTRRAREAALYLTPDAHAVHTYVMPQAVEPESSLARSPIASGGAVTVATGVATAVFQEPAKEVPATAALPVSIATVESAGKNASTVKTTVQQVRELAVDTLGIPPGAFLPVVLVVVGSVVIFWRRKQRRDGWA